MDSYILDTNLFFNMEEGIGLGEKTEEVISNLTKAAKSLKKMHQGIFYMPPKIVEEFLSFFENKEQVLLKDFLGEVTIQSPDYHKDTIGADIVYKLVEDIRGRSYRGLRVGEEEIIKAGQLMAGKGALSKKDFEMTIGEATRKFRERYRQATRVGFLDSVADLDLIMLAKETSGYIVTTDTGVLYWGRMFGVKEIPGSVFGQKVRGVV